jgi:hypothetical protein
MPNITSLKLIELLAQHVAEHGNTPIYVQIKRIGTTDLRPISNCRWDKEYKSNIAILEHE